MPDTDSYALWIMPEGDAYKLTNSYITKLSDAYDLPKFEPHVTLLGSVHSPDASTLQALAHSLPPFRIRFASQPQYLDEYFRCLFLKAHETPELVATFSKASQLFGFEGLTYFPHLSLAYGDLSVETKLEMIQSLGEIPEIEFEARHLSLVSASTGKPISSWKVVERFPLILVWKNV